MVVEFNMFMTYLYLRIYRKEQGSKADRQRSRDLRTEVTAKDATNQRLFYAYCDDKAEAQSKKLVRNFAYAMFLKISNTYKDGCEERARVLSLMLELMETWDPVDKHDRHALTYPLLLYDDNNNRREMEIVCLLLLFSLASKTTHPTVPDGISDRITAFREYKCHKDRCTLVRVLRAKYPCIECTMKSAQTLCGYILDPNDISLTPTGIEEYNKNVSEVKQLGGTGILIEWYKSIYEGAQAIRTSSAHDASKTPARSDEFNNMVNNMWQLGLRPETAPGDEPLTADGSVTTEHIFRLFSDPTYTHTPPPPGGGWGVWDIVRSFAGYGGGTPATPTPPTPATPTPPTPATPAPPTPPS